MDALAKLTACGCASALVWQRVRTRVRFLANRMPLPSDVVLMVSLYRYTECGGIGRMAAPDVRTDEGHARRPGAVERPRWPRCRDTRWLAIERHRSESADTCPAALTDM